MKKQLITLAALAGGFVLGASALVALADSTWTSAPAGGPPNNNVPAPINVGTAGQTKNGPLTITGLLGIGSLQFLPSSMITTVDGVATGNVPANSVLGNTDSYGTVGWRAMSGAAASGVSKIIAGTNVTVSPTAGTGEVTVNASSAGTVGGGCLIQNGNSPNNSKVINWGNANGSGWPSGNACACPSGYNSQLIASDELDQQYIAPHSSYLCIKE